MKTKKTAYLSLGSNLEDRLTNLQDAVENIAQNFGEISKVSSVYETPSWGFNGNIFYNICIELKTSLPPKTLLKKLLELELFLGRKRNMGKTYQNRNIDIDIIFYENVIIDTPELVLPHPKAFERKFVLLPLNEIAENFTDPKSKKTIKTLLNDCTDKDELKITNLQITH